MIDLTNTTEVVELLNRAVAEKGDDYEYPHAGSDCAYFEPDGSPSCIVGHVLAYKGLSLQDMVVIDGYNEPYNINIGESVFGLVKSGVINVTDKTREILLQAQRMQDDGYEWGAAVANAVGGEDY